jgi:hypothetical protein
MDRKWMGAHYRIDSRVRQLRDVLARVAVRQNANQLLLIHYQNLSESACFHLLMC